LKELPTSQSILTELADNVTDLTSLEIKINRKLVGLLPKKISHRARRIAIDQVKTPYHGTVAPEQAEEVVRSLAEHGTSHFFVYATAYAIWQGRRYTLAIYRVRAGEKMIAVVQKLLQRLKQIGIRVRLLLLDRGFYNVAVISYLITQQQAFIMPAILRGRIPQGDKAAGGLRVYAQLKQSCWARYTLKNTEGEITFDLAVVCRNRNGRYNRNERETWLYATWGVQHKPFCWVKEVYRSRFGIESSYRQLHQARIKTATRNPALRLLFVTIALLLRNVWVWLHSEVIAQPNRGHRILALEQLRFQRLLLWLLVEIAQRFKLLKEIVVPFDINLVAQDFGLFFNYWFLDLLLLFQFFPNKAQYLFFANLGYY
jgi:putative transposase